MIHDPRQIVMTLDHDVQNKSEKNLTKYRQIEERIKGISILSYLLPEETCSSHLQLQQTTVY